MAAQEAGDKAASRKARNDRMSPGGLTEQDSRISDRRNSFCLPVIPGILLGRGGILILTLLKRITPGKLLRVMGCRFPGTL